MNSSPDDDFLEQSLRASVPPPLPDDGFTQRVLAALPPAASTPPLWALRRTILIVVGISGGALAAWRQTALTTDPAALRDSLDAMITPLLEPLFAVVSSNSGTGLLSLGIALAALWFALTPRTGGESRP